MIMGLDIDLRTVAESVITVICEVASNNLPERIVKESMPQKEANQLLKCENTRNKKLI